MNEKDVVNGVLDEFAKLAEIPRKSGHEKQVSDFLYSYLQSLGLKVVQDETYNIIADKPAAKGYENAPLTILQAHMDMVCVAADGVEYDPLTDPIQLVRTEEYLEADGTSLGSDDGSGIAEIIYIIKKIKNNGPIRVIFTVDEEVGMKGAIKLDAQYVQDAKYLINCDSENVDELTVGSAGSVGITFARKLSFAAPKNEKAVKIVVNGLLGGHSGERIGDGRGNAIHTAAEVLAQLQEEGVSFELASLCGGKAHNAIAAAAEAVIVIKSADEEKVAAVCSQQQERFLQMHGAVDPDGRIAMTAAAMPSKVFTADEAAGLIDLLTILHTGVYAMSQVIPGLVETSANLGEAHLEDDVYKVVYFPRSAVDQKLDEIARMAKRLGKLTGYAAEIGTKAPGWKERKDSNLAKIMADTYLAQNGSPMKVETIHAGLECGWYFMKNPKLDMVSIGVTTENIHSPKERLILATIPPQVALIEETLKKIAAEK